MSTVYVVSNDEGIVLSVWDSRLQREAQAEADKVQIATRMPTYLHVIEIGYRCSPPREGQSISMKNARMSFAL